MTLADDAKTRTWSDATGTFSVTAELVDVKGDTVRLKRKDGKVITVALDQLSSADQQYLASLGQQRSDGEGPDTIALNQLTGKPTELKKDDGKAAGKKSFPRGIASAFQVDGDNFYLTEVRIHGSRYGTARPPREDFHITLCDSKFKQVADFTFPYSKFARGSDKWVTLRCKPTKVPRQFVVCLNFNAQATKGVYVSHDQEGTSLVGLPGKPAGRFSGGDWMIRVSVDQPK
jgi:hypothetical protein